MSWWRDPNTGEWDPGRRRGQGRVARRAAGDFAPVASNVPTPKVVPWQQNEKLFSESS